MRRAAHATPRQIVVLAAYVAVGGSVPAAAALMGIRPSTAKRHLADLRTRSGLSTERLVYAGRAAGWLSVAGLAPLSTSPDREPSPGVDPTFCWSRGPDRRLT